MATTRRVPLPRESIDDHLEAAFRRYPELAAEPANASRAFVRDLIRQGFISKPDPIKKRSGPGRAVRFTQRDYRSLLEILLLRARGHLHRRTWRVWLWHLGREYPLDQIRAALAEEMSAQLKVIRAEIAPTGRFTEPFTTKYRRRVAPSRADSPFPDLGGIEEPLVALMMRPQEAADIPFDFAALASMVATAAGGDAVQLLDVMQTLGASPSTDLPTAMTALAEAMPPGPFRAIFQSFAVDAPEAPSPPDLTGLIDDGHGKSALLRALDEASDEQLRAARCHIRMLRTGRLEQAIREAALAAPHAGAEPLRFIADWARMHRELLRGNPALAAHYTCLFIHSNGPPIPVAVRQAVDVDALLKALHDKEAP
jgi:hypothetical protein